MSCSCQGKKTTKKFLHLSSSFLGYMLLEIAVSLLHIVFISFYLLVRIVFLGLLDIKISSIFYTFFCYKCTVEMTCLLYFLLLLFVCNNEKTNQLMSFDDLLNASINVLLHLYSLFLFD